MKREGEEGEREVGGSHITGSAKHTHRGLGN